MTNPFVKALEQLPTQMKLVGQLPHQDKKWQSDEYEVIGQIPYNQLKLSNRRQPPQKIDIARKTTEQKRNSHRNS